MRMTRRRHAIGFAALALATVLCAFDIAYAQGRIGRTLILPDTPPGPELAERDAERREQAVREALQRYSAALATLDANAVKKIQPSTQVERLARAFQDMRELKVVFDAVRVLTADDTTARVMCRVTQTITPKVGPIEMTAVTRVVRLQRRALVENSQTAVDPALASVGTWVIDGFER